MIGRFAQILWAVAFAAASRAGLAVTSQSAIGENKVGDDRDTRVDPLVLPRAESKKEV